jgi:hypothetical protein
MGRWPRSLGDRPSAHRISAGGSPLRGRVGDLALRRAPRDRVPGGPIGVRTRRGMRSRDSVRPVSHVARGTGRERPAFLGADELTSPASSRSTRPSRVRDLGDGAAARSRPVLSATPGRFCRTSPCRPAERRMTGRTSNGRGSHIAPIYRARWAPAGPCPRRSLLPVPTPYYLRPRASPEKSGTPRPVRLSLAYPPS